MIDIDFFKSYNDAYGHQEGDECLKNVADTLKQVFKRAGDLVARYGGEEFVILLPDLDVVQAQALAEQIHQHLARLNLTHHQSPYGRATVSIGVASCVPNTSLAPSDLVKEADKALYQAKAAGRNQTRRFEGFF
jgi:diguanylate cyclase (GGDEF)-like protein